MRQPAQRKIRRPRLAPVIPFPAQARRGYIGAIAANMLSTAPEFAEDYLLDRIQFHRYALARKRVEPAMIEEDCNRFEAAIRAELWRLVMVEGGCK